MSHTNMFAQLTDRNSPMVVDALTRNCKICGSKAGALCFMLPINTGPLSGRLVHFYRTEVDD